MTPPSILSVDIPISAHQLCEGSLKSHHHDMLHSLLTLPSSTVLLNSTSKYSSLWSITRLYLQNQQLKTILDLASSPSSIGHHCNTLRSIQQEIEKDLFSTFYQLQMPKFINDVE